MNEKRKYKRVYAFSDDMVFFEMQNGYYCLVNLNAGVILAMDNPLQYERFNPYLTYGKKVPPKLLRKGIKGLKTLPIKAISHSVDKSKI